MPTIPLCTSPFLLLAHHKRTNASTNANFTTTITTTTSTINSTTSTTSLSLLKSYSRAGLMHEARAVFNAMPEKTPVSWTVLISAYALHGPSIEALSLLRDMLRELSYIDPFVLSAVLKACASIGSLERGRELHCAAVKLGYVEDLFVANALVTMYSNCGAIRCSLSVFKRIQLPDLVSWSSMLSGLAKNGYEEEALRLFVEMACAGIRFDPYVLSIALKVSCKCDSVDLGSMIHCHMIKMGLHSCLFLMNSLLESYGRIGELGLMRKLFGKMLRKDLVSWNTIISCHARRNCNEEVLMFFRILMSRGSFGCDEFTLGSALRAVTDLGALDHGKEIHGYAIRSSFRLNSYVMSALLDMYIKCADLDTLPIRLFMHFNSLGGELDEFIVASVIKWCASVKDLETGKMVHSCILRLGLSSDSFVTSSLIDMYAKCGILGYSVQVFAGIQNPGTVPWSSIVAAYCCNDAFLEALSLFALMQLDQVRANEFTYTSAILACTALRDHRHSSELHCNIIRRGYSLTAAVMNSLMNLYLELGRHEMALKLALSSLSEDESYWDSLIQAFGRAKDHDKILELFRKIQQTCGQLDHESACYVLKSCECLFLIKTGIQAHAYFIKRGLVSDPNTSNSLIHMYSKCGEFEVAIDTFNRMTDKNAASWTAVISTHIDKGHPYEALNQFMKMVRKGKSPDTETFLFVLKACEQIGLIDKAFRLFTSMIEDYKLEPTEEIYCTMVEALGAAGMLEEAEHFIGSVIPFEPGPSIWRTLLNSCQVHNNTKIAKVAALKLVEIDPTDFTANVLLDRVLLQSGRWNAASKLDFGTSSPRWIETRANIVQFVHDKLVTKQVSGYLAESAIGSKFSTDDNG